jgi:pilus assembly protein CpaB
MRPSTVTLAAATALGLVAGIGVFVYTAGAEERALADQQPIGVYVTTQPIEAGTSFAQALADGAVEPTQVPAASVPIGVLTEPTTAMALAEIPSGQIVMATSFGDQAPVLEPIAIAPDQMGVTLALGDPQRVGSFLRPGSSIAIFNTTERPEPQTRLLLFDVTVLAVGNATNPQSADEEASNTQTALITVAVNPDEAERLVHAAQTGSIYLALLSGEAVTMTTAGVSDVTLYGQEQR